MGPADTLLNFFNRRDISAKDIDLAFEVPGRDIGVRLAEKILEERKTLGGFFRNIKELDETPGLGRRRMEFMLDFAERFPERLDEAPGSIGPTETPNVPEPTSISLTSVSPNVLPTIGGTKLLIEGVFVPGQELQVFITKSSKRTLCYSGIPGSGPTVLSSDGKTLHVIAPAMVAGTGYDLELEHEGVIAAKLLNAISVVAANYGSGVFAGRNMFPGWAATGPRAVSAT